MRLRLTKGLQIFLVSFQRNLSLGTRLICYEVVFWGMGGAFSSFTCFHPIFERLISEDSDKLTCTVSW